jgi:hypothetical protein
MAEGFFSREAGQKRRAALEQGLMHYVPPELRGWLGAASMFNPVTDMEQAGQKARIVASPDATGQERFNAGVGMVTDMATVVAPAYGASKVGTNATAATIESLLGFGAPAREGLQDAGRRFAMDEAGAVPLRGGGMSDPTQTGWTFRDMDRSLTTSLSGAENRRIAGDTARIEELPIRQMYATQPTVNPDFALTQSSAGELPLVVRKDGRLFVMDGHHRLTKSAEDGAQTARTRFIDLDGRETDAPLLDYRPEQNSFTAADDDLLAQLLGDQQPPSKADEIARMLREGRADEITDDMMGALDPNDNMRLFQLYEDGATGLPMPMDEASRMARAREMGLVDDQYHATMADFDAFMPSQTGLVGRGVYSGDFASDVSDYARAGSESADGLNLIPLRAPAGDTYARRIDWQNTLDADEALPWNATVEETVDGFKRAADKMTDQGFPGVQSQAGERVTFDPRNIRSRFARFDPRLKHLANLSAGVGGVAYLGNQGEDQKAAQIRAYLEGL